MRETAFGRKTGLRVFEYALGTANSGTGWGAGAEPDEGRPIFDRFAEAGGTLLDSADSYLAALDVQLTDEQYARLDKVAPCRPAYRTRASRARRAASGAATRATSSPRSCRWAEPGITAAAELSAQALATAVPTRSTRSTRELTPLIDAG